MIDEQGEKKRFHASYLLRQERTDLDLDYAYLPAYFTLLK